MVGGGSRCGFGVDRQVNGTRNLKSTGRTYYTPLCRSVASASLANARQVAVRLGACTQRRPPVQRAQNCFGGDANAVSNRQVGRRRAPEGKSWTRAGSQHEFENPTSTDANAYTTQRSGGSRVPGPLTLTRRVHSHIGGGHPSEADPLAHNTQTVYAGRLADDGYWQPHWQMVRLLIARILATGQSRRQLQQLLGRCRLAQCCLFLVPPDSENSQPQRSAGRGRSELESRLSVWTLVYRPNAQDL